jgi:hypothetical protein
MIQVQTVDDVYPALDEVVVELNATVQSRLATILHHRMHQVAWTARSELFEELRDVLTDALKSDPGKLTVELKQQMERVLVVIRDYLEAKEREDKGSE